MFNNSTTQYSSNREIRTELAKANLDSPSNIAKLSNYTLLDRIIFHEIICDLNEVFLLNQMNLDLVFSIESLDVVRAGLSELFIHQELLTQTHFEAMMRHSCPLGFSRLICQLYKNDLFCQDNLEIARNHSQPWFLSIALEELSNCMLATQENFLLLASLNSLPKVTQELFEWMNSGNNIVISQLDFDSLISFKDTQTHFDNRLTPRL